MDNVRSDTLTIGTSNTSVLPLRPQRIAWSIKNTSTGGQVISLARGQQAAVAGYGQVLSPNDSINESDSEAFQAWRGEIQAISSAAGGTIAIFERLKA